MEMTIFSLKSTGIAISLTLAAVWLDTSQRYPVPFFRFRPLKMKKLYY
jgi:hypothetical protein